MRGIYVEIQKKIFISGLANVISNRVMSRKLDILKLLPLKNFKSGKFK